MPETRPLLERVMERVELRPFTLEGFHDRRDRNRRNQRIAAGVVGITVFVAAIWIVTSGASLDRSETSVVPGGEVTGPAETAPPRAPASAPDVVSQGECSAGARVRLELRYYTGGGIEVQFEVHRSPGGHSWYIVLRRATGFGPPDHWPDPFFEGTWVASDSGDIVVQRRVHDREGWDSFKARAVDTQTGQVCRVIATL